MEDQTKRGEFLTFLRNAHPPEAFCDPELSSHYNLLHHDDTELIKSTGACSDLLYKRLGENRIYCLTPIPDSTLMWSHYADHHRGICLEFDKDSDLIGMSLQVRYRDTYPELLPQNRDVLALVLTKSSDWSYEQEFRIIASTINTPAKLHGDFVMLPDGALTAIIVGCQCKHYSEILSIVKNYYPSVAVKRALRVPNHYKLSIQV